MFSHLRETRERENKTIRRQQTVCCQCHHLPCRSGFRALCHITLDFVYPFIPEQQPPWVAASRFGESEAHHRRGDPGSAVLNDPNDGDRVLSHCQPWQALLEQRVGGELPERKGILFQSCRVQLHFTLFFPERSLIHVPLPCSFSHLFPFLLAGLPGKQWARWGGADRFQSTSVWPLPPHSPTGLDQWHRPAYGSPGMQHSRGNLRRLTEPTDSISQLCRSNVYFIFALICHNILFVVYWGSTLKNDTLMWVKLCFFLTGVRNWLDFSLIYLSKKRKWSFVNISVAEGCKKFALWIHIVAKFALKCFLLFSIKLN